MIPRPQYDGGRTSGYVFLPVPNGRVAGLAKINDDIQMGIYVPKVFPIFFLFFGGQSGAAKHPAPLHAAPSSPPSLVGEHPGSNYGFHSHFVWNGHPHCCGDAPTYIGAILRHTFSRLVAVSLVWYFQDELKGETV